jgi:predicted Zn-dependent peptidase
VSIAIIDTLSNIVKKLTDSTGAQDLENCKLIRLQATAMALSSTLQTMNYYALEALFMDTNDPVNRLQASQQTMDIAEFKRVAAATLKPNQLTIAATGDVESLRQAGGALSAAISGLGKS